MADVRTLYDEDFVAWTEQQAEVLRSAAHGKTNHPLDWENLAEEIESLGKSDRRELRSQIYRVVRHLAKLQFSAATDPRDGWRDSVTDGRKRAELILADSPSLKAQLDQFVSEEGAAAVERAVADLEEFGELDRQTAQALRSTRYTVDQILGNWFPTAPQPSAGRSKRAR
jgi:predicted RNA-binding protein